MATDVVENSEDAYIITCALLSFVCIHPYGNLSAIDTLFFGASSSTESGLNTVDVNDLRTAQQVFIYVVPILTNLMVVNIVVVIVRLYWFNRKFKEHGYRARDSVDTKDAEASIGLGETLSAPLPNVGTKSKEDGSANTEEANRQLDRPFQRTAITFANDRKDIEKEKAFYIPSPRARELGQPIIQVDHSDGAVDEDQEPAKPPQDHRLEPVKRRHTFQYDNAGSSARKSVETLASTLFVLGRSKSEQKTTTSSTLPRRSSDLPNLSRQVTLGRNSSFHNLTSQDREVLGGIEYRSLKLLLKITIGYLLGIHVFGVGCLLPWIHRSPAKYTDWLVECGIGKTWWAFYSSQTMIDNLGFTLTPDSMISFRDATWPMLVMTFLAFAGNTCYPILLRLVIYIMSKIVTKGSSTHQSLQFLLDHPRRCYTLLFPSGPTWVLFGILFVLNFVDVLLIIVLDLNNPAVNDLPMGPRILSALFQAASARHTGTATLNLANVNPAVQFSLLAMMYIAVYPIAISVRASNTYEDKTLGLYGTDAELDESSSSAYLMHHVRNQLSFDLWYVFLGTFAVCASEAKRISDNADPAFSVFSIFFEVVSAYGNVGLSLGHPDVLTSLSGQFKPFSKFVICAMMIRGRHRGLPYGLDRAIMLTDEER
ncbi:putative cation transport protein 1 [Elsinoe australis]|uniref:Putative cation transport protein 1 n=1 Tax=Elsinoe australis TaxID=40998 RepID=A0A4V6DUA1_9PEZI|nr:putative cation transport protein 1 [Elsinoe australis]